MQRTPVRWARAFDIEVGSRIRARRLQLGTTQRLLAHKVRVTDQQLQDYESGAERVPAPTLEKLAEALSVTVFELLPATKR